MIREASLPAWTGEIHERRTGTERRSRHLRLDDEQRDPHAEARAKLILALAADRLRELRDDGVTFGYIARMYEVPTDMLQKLHTELVPTLQP
ncbi:MAG TPA: hypothetical protein VFE05_16965 [Longimicrobiaceae bacterium]|jgi:hypothetical protein|nr:hypothetical protein [Longimicrobiaceae bacterium]